MRTTAVEATASNAGVPARRKAVSISAMIKAAEPAKISKSKSNAERQSDATPKNSRRLIPSGIDRYRPPVNQPRIIGRHVDHLRIGRFNNDCVSLCSDPLLLAAIQVPSLLSVLTHLLNSVGHILWIVRIRLAQC